MKNVGMILVNFCSLRIRIRVADKVPDPPDPDPQHFSQGCSFFKNINIWIVGENIRFMRGKNLK